MLMDSANIQESEARETDEEPYYTRKDVSRALQQFVGLSFEKWHYLTDEVRFFLRNTGHMLGSASVSLEVKEEGKKILFGFTGDIGRGNRPILPDPAPMPEMDYLICESTYGNKDHETAANETDRLVDIVEEICLKRKGKLLIPAFSVGRTQEIVYLLDQAMTQRSLPAVTVYVDSPMAINAVEVFRMHPECFDEEMNNYLQDDPNPFGFKSLFYVRSSEESKELPFSDEPCIIISASGMMNSGRAKSHLANLVEDSKNGVLLVGYASPNSPAGKLKRGEDSIHLYNDWKKVNLKVFSMDSFSAHADRYELLAFIRNQAKGLKKLFLTHGEYDTQIAFKALLNQYGFDNVEIPSLGQVFEIGE
jgi:metallo-beta-lactamase family protein